MSCRHRERETNAPFNWFPKPANTGSSSVCGSHFTAGSCLGKKCRGALTKSAKAAHSRKPAHQAPSHSEFGTPCPEDLNGSIQNWRKQDPRRNPVAGPRAPIEYITPKKQTNKYKYKQIHLKVYTSTMCYINWEPPVAIIPTSSTEVIVMMARSWW